jgi:hypothetical protein
VRRELKWRGKRTESRRSKEAGAGKRARQTDM